MKTGRFFAAIIIGWVMLSSISFGYSGGNGEPNNPYQIADVNDLLELGATTADYNKSFILMADIDLAGQTFTQPLIAVDTIVSSSAFQGTQFTGVFDGNDHIISNLTIIAMSRYYVGLFGYLGSGGQIKNLGVKDVNITGLQFVGALVGYSRFGTITSCSVTGIVTGHNDYVGGLVGITGYSSITSSCAAVTVSSHGHVGGLVGQNDHGTITTCYASGTVSNSSSNAGGLVGYNTYGMITSCYATGAVSSVYYNTGGLIGFNDGYSYVLISACYATGNVSGLAYVGGLVGDGTSDIATCFWDMETSGQTGSFFGKGLTTEQMKTLSIYQNAGWADKGWEMADGEDYPHLAWEHAGGEPIPRSQAVPLAGSGTEEDPYLVSTAQEFALLSWYWGILDKHIQLTADLDLSGEILYPIGDLGSFSGVFEGGGHTLSHAVINQPSNNYVGLFSYVNSHWNINLGKVQNLGLENVTIAGNERTGALVGKNFGNVISCRANGSVNGTSYVGGLVGENNNFITNCYSASSITGSSFVGGLAGFNGTAGIITSCCAVGTVSGSPNSSYVGGLAGYNYNSGRILASYATSSVTGSLSVGGLVGYNDYSSKIINCYAAGSVSGSSNVGGLVGYNNIGNILYSYSTGAVSGVTNVGGLLGYKYSSIFTGSGCFWDTQTSGQMNSAAGVGRTTAQMMMLSTYIYSFDFTNETTKGTEDIWRMCANGVDYPRLNWESIDGDLQCPNGVTIEDLDYFIGRWMLENCTFSNNYCSGADVDYSGKVDLGDFAVFAEHWLEGV